jgi:hypothetical protein
MWQVIDGCRGHSRGNVAQFGRNSHQSVQHLTFACSLQDRDVPDTWLADRFLFQDRGILLNSSFST